MSGGSPLCAPPAQHLAGLRPRRLLPPSCPLSLLGAISQLLFHTHCSAGSSRKALVHPSLHTGYQATGGVPRTQAQGHHQAVTAECRSPPRRAGSRGRFWTCPRAPDPPGCRRLSSGPGRAGGASVRGFLAAQRVGSPSQRASSPWIDTGVNTCCCSHRPCSSESALSGQGSITAHGVYWQCPTLWGKSRLWQSFKTQFLNWQLSGVGDGGWLQRSHGGGFWW